MQHTITRREWLVIMGAVAIATPVFADETTLQGQIVCAKCSLKKPDAAKCQDVLLVTEADGAVTEYYVTKNQVAQDAGEVCKLVVPARIVGEVSERDGRKWITASKIVRAE